MAANENEPVSVPYDLRPADDVLFLSGEAVGDDEDAAFLVVEDEPIPTEASQDVGEIYVFPEDLYAEIQAVLAGTREVPSFKVEPVETGFRITPPLRVGTSFVLPQDPSQFAVAVQRWTPDNQGAAYKALHEALFTTSAA